MEVWRFGQDQFLRAIEASKSNDFIVITYMIRHLIRLDRSESHSREHRIQIQSSRLVRANGFTLLPFAATRENQPCVAMIRTR
jgi:hypothetical protein